MFNYIQNIFTNFVSKESLILLTISGFGLILFNSRSRQKNQKSIGDLEGVDGFSRRAHPEPNHVGDLEGVDDVEGVKIDAQVSVLDKQFILSSTLPDTSHIEIGLTDHIEIGSTEIPKVNKIDMIKEEQKKVRHRKKQLDESINRAPIHSENFYHTAKNPGNSLNVFGAVFSREQFNNNRSLENNWNDE